MKRFKFYSMLIATAAVTFLAACGSDDGEDIKPDPAVNLKTTSGYTFSNVSVGVDSVIKAGILINHDRKIKNVKFQVTISGSTFTVLDSSVSDKVVDMDFIRKVLPTPGTEAWTITATDTDGKTGTASFTITITGVDPTLTAYDPVSPQKGVQIYNIKDPSPSNTSAFDLNTKTPASASMTTADNLKDILDQNTATSTYQPQWGTKTGVTYVKVTSSALTYASATKYSHIVDYFNTNGSAAVSLTPVISANDLYIAKAGDNGQYYLISIINVVDVANTAAGDHVEFKYKTL